MSLLAADSEAESRRPKAERRTDQKSIEKRARLVAILGEWQRFLRARRRRCRAPSGASAQRTTRRCGATGGGRARDDGCRRVAPGGGGGGVRRQAKRKRAAGV